MSTERLTALYAQLSLPAPQLYVHHAVSTLDEHVAALKAASAVHGVMTKNLFLKDKKTKQLSLVTVQSDTQVNLKALAKLVGASEVRFESVESLQSVLQVAPGSVTPLALINDTQKQVRYYVEKKLADSSLPWLVNTLENTSSIALTMAQLNSIAAHFGHTVTVLDLAAIPAPAAPASTAGASSSSSDKAAAKAAKASSSASSASASSSASSDAAKGGNQTGIDKRKNGQFAQWYSQVVTRSELIEYYDVSGCYILRPWSFAMWETIQSFIDTRIKKLGVKNSYFPLFVSNKALTAEKDHVEGFAPEVAWVTRSGGSDLPEPIAVRPTSETIMYPAYAKWIRSHRDLPLKLNQWSNVVRWEFKCPTPFIRSREFLWQEGHTAFATKPEADEEVLQILDIYAGVYEQLLAVPVTKGKKTETEKFAGGLYTTTVEAFVPATGRGIQGATSHCLGQNFAKMFNIEFENERGEKQRVWQNSWGLTTRTIGVMVMVHSDDKGLVLPPRMAPTQVIIVPIFFKDRESIKDKARHVLGLLNDAGVRTEVDERENYTPGWKYNFWEMKGVPLRLELGPEDIKNERVVARRRDQPDKAAAVNIPWSELATKVPAMLEQMQADLLARAIAERDSKRKLARTWEEFMRALDHRNTALAPHCADRACEKAIKERSGEASKESADEEDAEHEEQGEKLTGAAKSLCIPFEQPELPAETPCVGGCGRHAVNWTLFGRSY